ncbi:MAG TPA: TetR family transcriptional regulator [Burkholderiales bacterium]|jgi:TetR/AcrR family acrAB operon transcriptional repressor|nr:TetR family transcriptional regulator [Burkholderiales bacterium]
MRRTKQEAQQTRRRIMDAALRVFDRHGISRTTLDQIADAARVTRGAIYWHFSGKAELLRAIREDVSLPLVDQSDFTLLNAAGQAPLECVERFLLDLLHAVEKGERTRLAFSVMSFKCEYVGELESELEAYARKLERLFSALSRTYAQANAEGALREGITPRLAARGTIVFLVGLMRLWLLDDTRVAVRQAARGLVKAHVDGYRNPMAHGRREHRRSESKAV